MILPHDSLLLWYLLYYFSLVLSVRSGTNKVHQADHTLYVVWCFRLLHQWGRKVGVEPAQDGDLVPRLLAFAIVDTLVDFSGNAIYLILATSSSIEDASITLLLRNLVKLLDIGAYVFIER